MVVILFMASRFVFVCIVFDLCDTNTLSSMCQVHILSCRATTSANSFISITSGFDNGYITWVANNKTAWTMNAAGVGPDSAAQISARPISQEPMVRVSHASSFCALNKM